MQEGVPQLFIRCRVGSLQSTEEETPVLGLFGDLDLMYTLPKLEDPLPKPLRKPSISRQNFIMTPCEKFKSYSTENKWSFLTPCHKCLGHRVS